MDRHALAGARLIDGTAVPPRDGMTVIWEGEHITWVGHDGEADLTGAEVTMARGMTVVPGLIDAHVHLCIDPVLDGIDRVANEPPAILAIRSAAAASRMLDHGITQVRDMGSAGGIAVDAAKAHDAGVFRGARIVAVGRGITPPGGHGWMIGVECRGAAEVRAAVNEEVGRGARAIKLFPTGGVLGSGAHGFAVTMTLEEMTAAVEEAHALGVPVGAHIHGVEGVDLGLEAGVATIEHGTGLTGEQARRMADQGVALVPTLAAVQVIRDHIDQVGEALTARAEQVLGMAGDGIRRAIEAGVRVLAGTDAGTPFNPPGRLTAEMQLLADLGLGTDGALRAATGRAAAALRLDEVGTIVKAKRADLVMVDGDPLDDLAVLDEPALVIQDGAAV
jgi:imidazolonepropionase-like amidohydrolase